MPRTAITGTAMIAIASVVLAVSEHSLRPRHALYLSRPISMSAGRVSTGEFGVDISESYRFAIEFKKPTAIPSDTLDCLVGLAQWEPQVHCGETHSVVKLNWTIYSGGRVVGRGSAKEGNGYWSRGPTVTIGGFHGEEGHRYSLDVDILTDGSQLAPAEPQLVIQVANLEYYDSPHFYSLLGFFRLLVRVGIASFILVGAVLLISSFARKHNSN